MRKFADKMEQTQKSNTETTLSLSSVDTRGSWPTIYIARWSKFVLSENTESSVFGWIYVGHDRGRLKMKYIFELFISNIY